MGWRGATIIFVSIPTTFALTLFIYYIVRLHAQPRDAVRAHPGDRPRGGRHDHRRREHPPARHGEGPRSRSRPRCAAIEEIGNPTILATLTVIASLLPMAFVRGLMGPYMRPMPIGASMAMAFSLFVAFVITP